MTAAISDPVVSFYRGGRDSAGRTLAQILAWDDDTLEAVHDYIQWVFPTTQPSAVNPDAPLISGLTVAAFAEDRALRGAMLQALDRMLAFYGLRRLETAAGTRIELDAARFPDRARTWLSRGNHNHLRLTRMLHSLSALELAAEAKALQRCLVSDIAGGHGSARVTERTLKFWNTAV